MSFKAILVTIGCLVILLGAGIPLFLHYMDVSNTKAERQALVDQGYSLLDEAKALLEKDENAAREILDEAIAKGMSARDLIPEGEDVSLLLGRAYYLKDDFNRSIDELNRGLLNFSDIDYVPELNYHLAVANTRLYSDLKQKEKFEEALAQFSKVVSSSSRHRVDAYFGIAMLFYLRLQESETIGDKEKFTMNFRRALQMEDSVSGYVEGQPDSSCPLCGMAFTKKSDNPSLAKFREWVEKN